MKYGHNTIVNGLQCRFELQGNMAHQQLVYFKMQIYKVISTVVNMNDLEDMQKRLHTDI